MAVRPLVIAAVDTGMRRGEMLALRFADIDFDRQLITLRGSTTKSGKTRFVPIPTERLRAALEWLRLDAAGGQKPAEALVFSDEGGGGVGSFRKAWVTAVLRAHDVEVKWCADGGYRQLAPECEEAFRQIDLLWNDIRQEYASRLVERGVPLAQVRDLLGHASITTTERYDNQTWEALHAAASRLESGKVFEKPDIPDAVTDNKCPERGEDGDEQRGHAARERYQPPAQICNDDRPFWILEQPGRPSPLLRREGIHARLARPKRTNRCSDDVGPRTCGAAVVDLTASPGSSTVASKCLLDT